MSTNDPFGTYISDEMYDAYVNQPFEQDIRTSKIDTLSRNRGKKLGVGEYKLTGLQGNDLQDEKGTIFGREDEWYGNKIVNDYNPAQLQYLEGRLYSEYGVFKDPETGALTTKDSSGQLAPYQGTSEDLGSYYGYGTGTEGVDKYGRWGGANPDTRYTNKQGKDGLDYYGNTIGPGGVDIEQSRMELLYPRGIEKISEGLQHGNRSTMNHRADLETGFKDRFGTGSTEAYSDGSVGAFGGDSRQYEIGDKEKLWKDFEERFGLRQVKQKAVRPAGDKKSFRDTMLHRESGGDYSVRNDLGYSGGYQFGASALETLGYLKKGSSKEGNKALENADNWTGKSGVESLEDFLSSKEVQDKAFDENLAFNENVLRSIGVIDDNTLPEDVQGYLAAAHLLGAGKVKEGLDNVDANNTSGLEYFNLGKETYYDTGTSDSSLKIQNRSLDEEYLKYKADSMDGLDRVGNALKGFVDAFYGEGVLDPADFFAEQVAGGDLIAEEDKAAHKYDVTGYNPLLLESSMDYVGKQFDILTDGNASIADRVKAGFNGVIEAITTPELLTTSLGTVAAWLAPGKILKVLGYGAQGFKALRAIDKAKLEGTLNSVQAAAEKAKVFAGAEGLKSALVAQSGQLSAALGNVNAQYDAFVANNDGVPLEGMDKVNWFATRLGVQMFNQNLEKIVDVGILKNPAMLGAAKDTVKALSNKEFSDFALGVSKTITGGTLNMSKEAGQEYAQTMMEMFNEKFGSEKFQDLDTFVKFVSDEDNIRESGIAALAGAGGAVQFEGVGAVGQAVQKGLGKGLEIKDKYVVSKEEPPVLDEDIKASLRADYISSVKSLRAVNDEGITEDNLGSVMDFISKAQDSREGVADSPNKELLAQAEKQISTAIDTVIGMIEKNPNLNLDKKVLEKDGATVPDKAIEAERVMHTILGSDKAITDEFVGKLTTFGKANGMSEERIGKIIKSYESVDEEARDGDRGFLAAENRIMGALESGDPDTKAVEKEFDRLTSFYSATLNSQKNLEKGIKKAKEEAARLNALGKPGKRVLVLTDYLKDEKDRKGNRKRFDIAVSYVSGKWTPDLKEAEKRLSKKKERSNEILSILKDVGSKGYKYLGDKVALDTFIIPKGSSKDKARSYDENYLSKTSKVLDEVGVPSRVSRVILDEKDGGTSPKWAANSDYRKANVGIINGDEEYQASDVVLLNAMATTYKKGDKTFYITTLYDASNPARKEVLKAAKAGATIVLDREYKTNNKASVSVRRFLTGDKVGYTNVPGTDAYVPKTDARVVDFAERKKAVEKERATEKKAKAVKDKALNSIVEMAADLAVGDSTSSRTEYNKTIKEVAKEYFKGDTDKVDSYVERNLKERVDAVKKSLEGYNAGKVEEADIVYDADSITTLAERDIEKSKTVDKDVLELLAFWKDAVEEEGLKGKKLEEVLEKKAKDLGMAIDMGSVSKSLLEEKAVGKDKPDLVEYTFKKEVFVNGKWRDEGVDKTISVESYSEEEATEYLKQKPEPHTSKGRKYRKIPISVKQVTVDPSKFVTLSKKTLLGSVPVEALPGDVKEVAGRFKKALEKILQPLGKGEKAVGEEYDTLVKKGDRVAKYGLYDSPARALIFDGSGIAPEVAAAMGLAVLDTISTDKRKLMKGYKNVEQIGQMFNVQPHEVTKEMMDFVKDIGSLKKTLATSVGKNVAKLLGYSKKNAKDLGYNTYERFIAELGQTALLAAEAEGLVEFKNKPSKDLADLLKNTTSDYNVSNDKINVGFVNIVSKKDKVSKQEVPVKKVDRALATFEGIADRLPEVRTVGRGPSLKPFSEKFLNNQVNSVHNDEVGFVPPKEAQDTLRNMMDTAYTFETSKVVDFLAKVDAHKEGVFKQLGYIDPESSAFEALTFEEKDMQISKNRDIEESIQNLRDTAEKADGKDLDLYFPFYYINNGRYQLDSTTINPQTDKLHRFLIQPKANERVYEYKDGVFTSDGKKVSFLVRMALGQAFGFGIDKEVTPAIIEFGNKLLGLTEKDLDKLETKLLDKGEASIKTSNGVVKVEAEHLTHALDGIDFLRQVKTGKVTSRLTAEFDSLTSGFANKVQQMPIFDDATMHEHLARVGVLTEEYLAKLESQGFEVKIGTNGAVNDVLGGAEGFLDSYKNLAKKTLLGLPNRVEALGKGNTKEAKKNAYKKTMFNKLASLDVLPGSDMLHTLVDESSIEISSSLRNMFKNPFMIFNYSAAISTIIKNLGIDISKDLISTMAKADLKDPEDKGTLMLEYLANSRKFGIRTEGAAGAPVMKKISPKELQQAIRNRPANAIKMQLVGNSTDTMLNGLAGVMKDTYGEEVKTVFEKEFAEYLDIQEVTNDAFKAMFRIFDSKRINMLKEAYKDKGYFNQEDMGKIQDKLWADFPYIMGPLSKRKDFKDIIPVVSKGLGTPNQIEQAALSGRTKLKKEGTKGGTGIVINPLVYSMEEARSAGSVLPYHFIDGAEMALMFQEFYKEVDSDKAGILGIHDAIMTALDESNTALFGYNKGMFNVNSGYSIVEEIQNMMNRIDLDGVNLDQISSKSLKTTISMTKKGKEAPGFGEVLGKVQERVKTKADLVKAKREEWADRLKTAWYGNMVGTPGGMYKEGVEVNSDYETEFETRGLYKVMADTRSKKKSKKPPSPGKEILELVSALGDVTDKYKECK